MAIIVSHYSTVIDICQAFQSRWSRCWEAWFISAWDMSGLDSQSYPDVSDSLKTEYCWLSGYPAIRLVEWGHIQHIRHIRNNNLSGLPDQPPCSFFSDRRQDKVSSDPVAWRWIGRHNRALQWKRTGRAGRWWDDTPCRLCKHTDNWPNWMWKKNKLRSNNSTACSDIEWQGQKESKRFMAFSRLSLSCWNIRKYVHFQ